MAVTVTFDRETDRGRLFFVESLSYAADVRVSHGLWPRIEILAFAHKSGVPGAMQKERQAIRRAVKKWLADERSRNPLGAL